MTDISSDSDCYLTLKRKIKSQGKTIPSSSSIHVAKKTPPSTSKSTNPKGGRDYVRKEPPIIKSWPKRTVRYYHFKMVPISDVPINELKLSLFRQLSEASNVLIVAANPIRDDENVTISGMTITVYMEPSDVVRMKIYVDYNQAFFIQCFI